MSTTIDEDNNEHNLSKLPLSMSSVSNMPGSVISIIPGITGKGDLSAKPHLMAISPKLLWEVGRVFRYGSKKHGKNNFRLMTSEAAQEISDSANRHWLLFLMGKPLDDESGLHHIPHIIANLSMLYRQIEREGDKAVIEVISGGDIK